MVVESTNDPYFLPDPQPKQIGDDFCGLVLNQPLGGLRVIEGNPLYEDRTEGMGAVAAYTYGEHTVVFVGTRSGQLKKVGGMEGWRGTVDSVRVAAGRKMAA